MADVRGTFTLVGLALLGALLVLAAAGLITRGGRAFWGQ